MEVLHVWTYQPFDLGLVIPLSLIFLSCGIRDINNVYFVESPPPPSPAPDLKSAQKVPNPVPGM